MKRKKSLIAALAAVLMFLLPMVSMAQVFTLSEEDENGRLSADGGIGWAAGSVVDPDTNEYLPLGNGIWVLVASAGLYLLVKTRKSRKTATLMLAALALTLGTTQCRKPTENVNESENETPATKTIHISLTCGNGFYPKADIDVSTGSYTWNTGDQVYVVYNGQLLSTTALRVTQNSNPVYGTVEGEIEVTAEIGNTPEFTFYYVGSGVDFNPAASSTSFTFNIADQTKSGKDVGEYMIGRTKAISMKKNAEGTAYVASESVVFKPITSVLRLNTEIFKVGDDDYLMKATGANAMNQMVIDLSNPSVLTCKHTADITFQGGADVSISVMPTTTDDVDASATLYFSGNGKVGSQTVVKGIKPGLIYAKVNGSSSSALPFGVIEGALSGLFSVSAGKQVYFSKGNLQYIGSYPSGTWKFADHQYDYLSVYSATAWDHFGWSTNANNNHWGMHTMTSNTSTYTDGGFNDWGKAYCNQQSIPENTWRTLTNPEWNYLLGGTTIPGSCRYASNPSWWIYNFVCIDDAYESNDVNGLIIYPDGITAKPTGVSADLGKNGTQTYNISKADFDALEALGCVFLPAAGFRNGTNCSNCNSMGYCWSSSISGDYTYNINFSVSSSGSMNLNYGNPGRYDGLSVRLVTDK